jgi:hypothetical protein
LLAIIEPGEETTIKEKDEPNYLNFNPSGFFSDLQSW